MIAPIHRIIDRAASVAVAELQARRAAFDDANIRTEDCELIDELQALLEMIRDLHRHSIWLSWAYALGGFCLGLGAALLGLSI